MAEDQDAHRAAVEAGYAPLAPYVAQNSVDIPAALWKHYRDIAIRERSSVRAVILDVLRKNVEGVA